MSIVDEIAGQANLLPREAQIEVLDFVGYLLTKYTPKAIDEDQAWDQVARPKTEPAPNPQR